MLELTLVAVTPKTMIALFARLGLDLVNDLSLLEDCFTISDNHHLSGSLRIWLRNRLRRNYRRWRRLNNNRSWWLGV
jgi:hypothetical protein